MSTRAAKLTAVLSAFTLAGGVLLAISTVAFLTDAKLDTTLVLSLAGVSLMTAGIAAADRLRGIGATVAAAIASTDRHDIDGARRALCAIWQPAKNPGA